MGLDSAVLTVFVSVGRSDFGIAQPVARALGESGSCEVAWAVCGADERAFSESERVVRVPSSAGEIGAEMGALVSGFASAFADLRPDFVVLVGDRYETICAALPCVVTGVPIVHLHGGELTYGAFDDSLRHAITKMASIHCVAAAEYGERVARMGEERWRIHLTGAAGLDTFVRSPKLSGAELSAALGWEVPERFLLATLHPETRCALSAEEQASIFLSGLEGLDLPVVFTAPNADPGGSVIRSRVVAACDLQADWRMVESFGPGLYGSVLQLASAMVGNSSSGILEAASARLPVVNIGARQDGRLRGRNVRDADWDVAEIREAVSWALAPRRKAGFSKLVNPYGDGTASEKIVRVILDAPPRHLLLVKKFNDAGAW